MQNAIDAFGRVLPSGQLCPQAERVVTPVQRDRFQRWLASPLLCGALGQAAHLFWRHVKQLGNLLGGHALRH